MPLESASGRLGSDVLLSFYVDLGVDTLDMHEHVDTSCIAGFESRHFCRSSAQVRAETVRS